MTISNRACRVLALLMLCGSALTTGRAWADYGVDETAIEWVNRASKVAPASVDTAFGDHLSLYDGSVEFNVVDLSLAGTGPAVELRRSFPVRDTNVREESPIPLGAGERVELGDWSLDLPQLSGVFEAMTGWQVNGDAPYARCSSRDRPKDLSMFPADVYWSGNELRIPGQVSETLLLNYNTARPSPSNGTAYPWTTKSGWMISCTSATANGYPGEGFIATGPDGTRYFLDWVVKRNYPGLTGPQYQSALTGGYNISKIGRNKIYFLATRVVDRFGNEVDYHYSGDRLTSITSTIVGSGTADRSINLQYNADGRLSSATAGTQQFSYEYTDGYLRTVTLPDTSKWSYSRTGLLSIQHETGDVLRYQSACMVEASMGEDFIYDVTDPAGLEGKFTFHITGHNKRNVPEYCMKWQYGNVGNIVVVRYWQIPLRSVAYSLVRKDISGLGVTPATWTYDYNPTFMGIGGVGFHADCIADPTVCPLSKQVLVYGPSRFERYTFGIWWGVNDGQLLKKEVGSSEDDILRTEDYSYVSQDEAEQLPFGNQVGSEIHDYSDPLGSYNRPLRSSVTTQQAATFSRRNVGYDVFARPTSVSLDSSLSPGKTEALTYWDNRAKWVIGQLRTVTCIAPAACKPTYAPNGLVESQTDYDADAQPIRQYRFGKLQQSRTYHADGTLATVTDGAGNTTTVDGWKRGIPQAITYPATPESPDGSSRTAWVDGNGWIQWTQDEYGFRTCYDYDAMGRLNRITYPSESQYRCDESAWAPTTITLADGYPAAYGVPAGHWRQTILAGNERHVVILDALFRPIVEQSLDLGNVSPTMTEVFNRYDAGGRQAFRSYPMNSGGKAVYSDTTLDGAHTSYDALDRVTRVDQDSELGVLRTQTDYLDGFLTRVTDPRSYRTWTSYMAYDEPTTQWPVGIQAAHATSSESDTDISRDPFGKPTAVTRHNLSGSVSATRRYVYDAAQELCKAIEPETGSSLQHFDAAGNVDWTAAGLDLPSTASCDYTAASVAARKVVRSYDTRNRLLGLGFPDGIGNQLWTYTRDGLPRTITTYNSPNAGTPVVNTYSYGHRRLLDSETMTQPGAAAASIGYEYDANGHLQSQTYPDGRTVDYVPNALGQATRAGWEGASNPVVWGATYYANGAVGHFSYGNGIRHWMIQNTRGLPDRVQDADDAGVAVHDDSYDYDANGNVAAISDGLSSAERGGLPLGDRTMTYDGLNRLNTVVSPMYAPLAGNTARSYFDALDNIGHLVAPDRNLYYCYDEHWRLTNLKIDSCDGTSVRAFGYDAQGNVTNDNGRIYDFDFGNRLRSVSYNGSVIESYRYDGLGRRVLSSSPTLGDIRSLYSRDGQLLFQSNDRTGQDTSYTYFAGSLVGESVLTVATGTYANRFQFTDALGSPVAVTNGPREVLERSEYEPFGKLLNRPMTDGPGFTGHEDDAATGLSYMQQRYYDPGIGRFLSVDPVTADGNTGGNFNRYWYANNNPYKFTDPDGRLVETFVDQIRSHQLDCGSACQFAFATKSKNSVSTKSCQLGNSLQNVSEKISDAGAKLEFGGLALAGYGASAIGPEGAIPGLTLSGVGGLGLTGGGALQAVGGALQIGADPSTGKHNLAAGLTSVATSALTSTLSSSFLRNGQNFVTRAFNQRVELKFATGGAVLDSLSQVSDFFETKQASCPVLSK